MGGLSLQARLGDSHPDYIRADRFSFPRPRGQQILYDPKDLYPSLLQIPEVIFPLLRARFAHEKVLPIISPLRIISRTLSRSMRSARVLPREEETIETLARYIIRFSFSYERMTYLQKESKALHQ